MNSVSVNISCYWRFHEEQAKDINVSLSFIIEHVHCEVETMSMSVDVVCGAIDVQFRG